MVPPTGIPVMLYETMPSLKWYPAGLFFWLRLGSVSERTLTLLIVVPGFWEVSIVILPVPFNVWGEAVLPLTVVKLHLAFPIAAVLIEAVWVCELDRLLDGVNVAVLPVKATAPWMGLVALLVTVNAVVSAGGALVKVAVMTTFTETSIAF
ncbi:MAG: hypothetical protein WCI75_14175, partial [candidate division NC10 bacterium]